MPLLDIATPQYSFRNTPYSIGFQRLRHGSVISGNQTTARSTFFKPNIIIHPSTLHMCRGRLMIKAVATLEPRCSDKENDNANHLPTDSIANLPGTDDEPVVLDDREILRRSRISDANRGREPWNKGRKHSAETREKIRESTRIAMRSEKVKQKLRNAIHSQTRETRSKIAAAVRVTWDKRRFQQRMMSHCQQEWRSLISEASRKGFLGEEELQWDSYETIQKELKKEYRSGVESRRELMRVSNLKPGTERSYTHLRAPKTPEQRRKISEAIAAKWADPTYRDRVYSGISKRRGYDPENRDPEWGAGIHKKRKEERKLNPPPRKKRESFPRVAKVKSPTQPKVKTSVSKVKKEPVARFKDPQANYKLEMIKSIRAQRAGSDPKISEAVLRANVLIGEAQRAAEALEEAAAKSPVAEASLIETRKLIAEAIRYIESIEMGSTKSLESDSGKEEKVMEDVRGIEQRGVNGIAGMGLSDSGIGKLSEIGVKDVANGKENIDMSSSSSWGDMGLKIKEVEGGGDGGDDGNGGGGGERKMVSEKQESKGRRWVCGRLVEDEDE